MLLVGYFDTVQAFGLGLVLLVLLEGGRIAFDLYKFGRQAAYHMWSAKFWGVSLLLGLTELFWTGQGGFFFGTAVVVGLITDLEGFWASIILPKWVHDVPTIVHAYRLRDDEMAAPL